MPLPTGYTAHPARTSLITHTLLIRLCSASARTVSPFQASSFPRPPPCTWPPLSHLAHPALQCQRQYRLPPLPQRMRDTVRLDGMVALEVQQRVAQGVAGGVLK